MAITPVSPEFAEVGTEVVVVEFGRWDTSVRISKVAKISKVTKTRVTTTHEVTDAEGNVVRTYTEQWAMDTNYGATSMHEYGQKYGAKTLLRNDDPKVAGYRARNAAADRQRQVRNAATEFANQKGQLTIEAAAELMSQLDAFIQGEYQAANN